MRWHSCVVVCFCVRLCEHHARRTILLHTPPEYQPLEAINIDKHCESSRLHRWILRFYFCLWPTLVVTSWEVWIRTIRGSLSLLGGGSKRTKTRKPVRLQSTEGFILVLFTKSKFLGGVISLNGLGLDDHRCIAALVILALVRNRPRHVTTRQQHTRHDDCHD